MILLSLMGCVGGCCRVKFLLVIFAIIVLIILISQIAVIALIAANGSDAEDKLKEGLRDSLDGFKEDLSDSKSRGWAALFNTFECCGIDNRTDGFSNMTQSANRQVPQRATQFPVACCKDYNYEDDKVDS